MRPNSDKDQEAITKAEMILKVRSGQLTAKAAAEKLGVSRKTYYKWEKRGLSGMVDALSDRPSGRPSQPVDGEKQNMRKEIEGLEKELLRSEQRLHARSILTSDLEAIEDIQKKLAKKKGRKNGDACPGDGEG